MKKIAAIVIAGCIFLLPNLSNAQQDTTAKKSKTERRKAMREKWQNATPEQKEKAKEKAKEMKARYDSLSPEQKEKLKEKMKERKEKNKTR
jgi:Spy/CpxP family protein refolding chaperone